ncbi:hypothetical protein [Pendulispora albinea]|uniref:Uncharacterized protein n=1 Tax=Pendulispora albinea TaxID=2741071 RepID=A0ABZ2M9I9_9BACT
MANTTDFITAVYDELAKILNAETSATSYLQMAWPGYALSPADFKRADSPNGPYDPEVAKESFSQLANIEPSFNKLRFENSGFDVDDLYEIVLTSAIPMGATVETVAANPIYRLFSDAKFELTQARRGLHDDPNGFYYPCSATPSNWYDEAAAAGWASVTLTQSDVKPAPPTSPFVKAGGLELAKTSTWRMKPAAADVPVLKSKLQTATKGAVLKPGIAAAPVVAAPVVAAPVVAKPVTASVAAPVAMSMATPVASSSAATAASLHVATPMATGAIGSKVGTAGVPVTSVPAKKLFVRAAPPTSVLARAALDVNRIDPIKTDLGVKNLAQRYALKTTLDKQLVAKPPSPTTDGFHISFKFCRVTIERPWFKLALLNTKNWWMFDTPGGEYSTGAAEANPGMFPLITTSFIVIRDLKITANWSQEDRQNLANAASFAFFDLRGGTLNNNTFEVKGLQVIAWLSRLMPKLPPLSPPP